MKQEEEEPILISDDEQQAMQIEQPVTSIVKGNTSFDIQYAYCREETKQLEDKEVQILSRLQRFFKERKFIVPGKEHIKPRKQPNYGHESVHAVGSQIIIFGVDFCKKRDFRKLYKPKDILVINQCNWKLIYLTREQAWAALRQNCKDPTQMVTKMQSDDDPIPRCWFQMKPYFFHTLQISVCARFATNEQLKFEAKEEAKVELYKVAKCIYNEQEQRRKEQLIEQIASEKQKIERRKDRISQNLYKEFENQAGCEWKNGINRKNESNNEKRMEEEKERSRSRSRDKKDKNQTQPKEKEKEAGNKDDVESNYSFLMSKSKNDAKELLEIFNELNFQEKEQNIQPKQNLCLVEAGAELPQANGNKNEYNWNGTGSQSTKARYQWSYNQYMQEKQREEEMRKQKLLIEVISIDD